MDIFALLTVFGGIAFFLYGMRIMGNGLEKLSGGRMEKILERLTSSPVLAVILGAAVTVVIQSSSATTVTVVGFVNSGIMKLSQAVGVIMGANIGTTVTGWILTLSGISGESIIANLFKSSTFTPIIALAGILMLMFSKKEKRRDVGNVMMGFAILMFAMIVISDAVAPLKDEPLFTKAIGYFTNPILGVLLGAVITTVLQSSSASVGILQALSVTGSITYGTVFPVIMGMNIGASVPPLLSCIGAKVDAKRAAFIYLYFNVIGTVICLPAYYIIEYFLSNAGKGVGAVASTSVGIALVNTVIKVVTTIILLPFTKGLCRLTEATIRDHQKTEEPKLVLEERFLKVPGVAIEQSRRATLAMADKARTGLFTALEALNDGFNEDRNKLVMDLEDEVDLYEDKLGTYLVKLSSVDMPMASSNEVIKLLHAIGDLERISDHACNILASAEEMHNKNINFSDSAWQEMHVMFGAVKSIVNMTIEAFEKDNVEEARQVEPLEQVIDNLRESLKLRHVGRLVAGDCTIELGFVFSDLLTNFSRISDHCSNIAVALIQMSDASFETHGSMNEYKNQGSAEFNESFRYYSEKYALPE